MFHMVSGTKFQSVDPDWNGLGEVIKESGQAGRGDEVKGGCSVAVVGGRRGFKGVVSSSAISRSGRLTCRIQAAVQRVGGGPRRQGEPPGVGRSKATLRLGPGGSWPARRPSVKCGGSVGSGAVSDRGSRGGGRRVRPATAHRA